MTGETASAAAACAGTSRWPGAASERVEQPADLVVGHGNPPGDLLLRRVGGGLQHRRDRAVLDDRCWVLVRGGWRGLDVRLVEQGRRRRPGDACGSRRQDAGDGAAAGGGAAAGAAGATGSIHQDGSCGGARCRLTSSGTAPGTRTATGTTASAGAAPP